jgi:hypothetical protein
MVMKPVTSVVAGGRAAAPNVAPTVTKNARVRKVWREVSKLIEITKGRRKLAVHHHHH